MSNQSEFVARRNRFSEGVRRPALAAAALVLGPLLRALDWAGLAQPIFRAVRDRDKVHLRNAWGDYRPTAHDVVICSYLKSGTNWMMQIAHQIAHRGSGEFAHIHDVVAWPDSVHAEFSIPLDDPTPQRSSPTGLRIIKTHLGWDHIPYSEQARYVCIVRDPKDVTVSAYHFVRDVMMGPLMPRVPRWIELFLDPEFPIGSWAAVAASYWAVHDRPNVLFLSYREMIEDSRKTITRVAEFMGVDLAPDAFEAICERSSFDYMKSIDERFYPGAPFLLSAIRGSMMRRGKQGSSSELLSREQQHHIDEHCRAELLRLGSDLPYDEICSPSE